MPLGVGERAPAFRLRGTDNAHWILGEPDRRASVLICFFRREARTCRLLLPFLERIHRRARAREAEILGVSLDTPRDSLEFAEDYSFTFPILIEREDRNTVRAFRVMEVPTLFRLDADLRVADALVGWSRAGFERIASAFLEATHARLRTVWEANDLAPEISGATPIPEILSREDPV
jgi:peroxiredoxin